MAVQRFMAFSMRVATLGGMVLASQPRLMHCDGTIVNVAFPHVQGTLSAPQDIAQRPHKTERRKARKASDLATRSRQQKALAMESFFTAHAAQSCWLTSVPAIPFFSSQTQLR